MQTGPEGPSAFALRCLGVSAPAGPISSRLTCAVCGTSEDSCFPRSALSENFAESGALAAPSSNAVCPACRFFAVGETWQAYLADHPELGFKVWVQASWRSFSAFFAPGCVEHPDAHRWGQILDAPPPPPWLAVITTSVPGRKNILFRGRVATDAALVPVLLETDLLWVEPDRWAALRKAFQALRALGMPRDCVLSGRYPSHLVLRAGIGRVRQAEGDMAPWRAAEPKLVQLAHYVSVKAKEAA